MKRWCKRPPAAGVTRSARQTPPGARPRGSGSSLPDLRERSRTARPSSRVGRNRPVATPVADGWSPVLRHHRIRLTDRLAPSDPLSERETGPDRSDSSPSRHRLATSQNPSRRLTGPIVPSRGVRPGPRADLGRETQVERSLDLGGGLPRSIRVPEPSPTARGVGGRSRPSTMDGGNMPTARLPQGAEWLSVLFLLFVVAAVVGLVLLVVWISRSNRRNVGVAAQTPAQQFQPSAPAVSVASAGPAPGWYHKTDDPLGVEQWWDGAQWTGHTRAAGGSA